MPGIVARIGGGPAAQPESDAVLAALRHFDFYTGLALHGDGGWLGWAGIGAAAQRLATTVGGRVQVAYHGDGAATASPAARQARDEAIATLAARPAELSAFLGGSFAAACLDTRDGSFHAVTDRFGHHRVYYRHEGDVLYLAGELKAFLFWPELDASADQAALVQLVNYGYPVGDRTSLVGVKLLPPASALHFRAGRLQVERYWRPHYEPDETADDDALCAEGHRLFRAAFAAKTAGCERLMVPVSGGLDSRMLLGEAVLGGRELVTYTFGHKHSSEAAVARELMRRMGTGARHVRTDRCRDPRESLRRTSWFVEGQANVAVDLITQVSGHFADEPRTTLFVNGIYGGPTNFSSIYHKPGDLVTGMSAADKVKRIGATMFSHRMHAPGNYRKLTPDFARRCDEAYEPELAALLPDHEGASPLFGYQMDAYFADNRLCRFMNQIDLNRYWFDEVIPLTSNDIYDFYLRLPERVKVKRLLHRRILDRYYRVAAGAPLFGSGLSVSEELAGLPPRPARVGRPDLRHLLGRATRGKVNSADPADARSYDYIYRRNREMMRYYEEVLGDPRPLAAEVFDFAEVRGMLVRAREGADVVRTLAKVMAWELWLRQLSARRWDV